MAWHVDILEETDRISRSIGKARDGLSLHSIRAAKQSHSIENILQMKLGIVMR